MFVQYFLFYLDPQNMHKYTIFFTRDNLVPACTCYPVSPCIYTMYTYITYRMTIDRLKIFMEIRISENTMKRVESR